MCLLGEPIPEAESDELAMTRIIIACAISRLYGKTVSSRTGSGLISYVIRLANFGVNDALELDNENRPHTPIWLTTVWFPQIHYLTALCTLLRWSGGLSQPRPALCGVNGMFSEFCISFVCSCMLFSCVATYTFVFSMLHSIDIQYNTIQYNKERFTNWRIVLRP